MDAKTDNKYAKKDSLNGFTAQAPRLIGYFGTIAGCGFSFNSPGLQVKGLPMSKVKCLRNERLK